MKEALFYDKVENNKVQCRLCSHFCLMPPGKRGICGVRENRDGQLVSLVYGHPVAQAVDPIEKKPLYHFLPGSHSFSISTRGCNFRCLHCQNWRISQVEPGETLDDGPLVEPERIVEAADSHGCASISYTYTEPTIFYEYAYDTAVLAAKRGIRNVFVTNGYITAEALRQIAPYLDAANIDLKFISDELYRKVCGARLQPVLDAIKLYHELGIWIELTTLIIPGHNNSEDDLRRIADFIAALDPGIPWHVTGFYPVYKLMEAEPTKLATLRMARRIGLESGLKHVYTGNLPDDEGSKTFCPACGTVLIARRGHGNIVQRIEKGKCAGCGAMIAGVW